MKTLKFDETLVDLVKNGTKSVTWRFFDDKDIRVGDHLLLINKQTNAAFGSATVSQVTEKLMSALKEDDYEGQTPFNNDKEMYELYSKYYGKKISPETAVKIIRYKYKNLDPNLNLEGHSTRDTHEVKMYADGGSRGNPGPSAGGYVIFDMGDHVIKKSGKYLGITTNNQAEYHALKGGIEGCLALQCRIVHVYMDSLLVVNQMKGIFKVKNRDLWPIHEAIKDLVKGFEKVDFTHVPRELNKQADAMVNETLDDMIKQNHM